MDEKQLERKLTSYCKSVGVLCYKWSSPAHRGVPDRILIGPLGVNFVELKGEGKKATPLQAREIEKINSTIRSPEHGFASCVDNWEDLKDLVDELLPDFIPA